MSEIVWHPCKEDGCDYKAKQAGTLRRHVGFVHNIGVTWHPCEEEGCDYKAKQANNLKTHLSDIHDIGVVWQPCEEEGCDYKAKQASTLRSHLSAAHNIGVTWHPCEEEGCDYKTKRASSLKQHLTHTHNIGVTWHPCEEEGCDYKAKTAGNLKQHLTNAHNIGVTWHLCEEEGCDYKAKRAGTLKRHLSLVHDIGPYECQFCLSKCAKLSSLVDAQGSHKVCRKCYRKATGYKCRVEKQMVEYLLKHYKQPMLRQDQRVNGEACLRYRPDVMYADPIRVVNVSCDEHQHTRSSSYTCDEKRMTDLYDEYPGKTVIWIRWNPDSYKSHNGKRKREERLKGLVEMLKSVETRRFQTKIHVIYMYYDSDNPLLVKNISKELVH